MTMQHIQTLIYQGIHMYLILLFLSLIQTLCSTCSVHVPDINNYQYPFLLCSQFTDGLLKMLSMILMNKPPRHPGAPRSVTPTLTPSGGDLCELSRNILQFSSIGSCTLQTESRVTDLHTVNVISWIQGVYRAWTYLSE